MVWEEFDGNDWEIWQGGTSEAPQQVTNNNHDDVDLSYDQSYSGSFTWEALDGNDWEIFFYNYNGITQITNNDYNDRNPMTSNGCIVWEGFDGHDSEIIYWDGNESHRITNNDYEDKSPELHITWSLGILNTQLRGKDKKTGSGKYFTGKTE